MKSRARVGWIVAMFWFQGAYLGAGPVVVEDQSRGLGVARSRGDECFVLTPAHLLRPESRDPDYSLKVTGAEGAVGSAKFSALVGTEKDDVALLRVVDNGKAICSESDTTKIKSFDSPTLVLRGSSGGLSFLPVEVVLDTQRTLAVRSQSELIPLAQMMSGALLVSGGREQGLLIRVSPRDETQEGEVRSLDYLGGLLGSWVQGKTADLRNIRDAWDIVKSAVEHKPIRDLGQVGAAEQIVGASLGFEGMALEGLTLQGARLADARFDEAKLSGGDFSRAYLERASFKLTFMPFMELSEALAPKASFAGAHLPYAIAEGIDLTGADLTRSNWFGARLSGANLKNADLAGASLMLADLRNADLRGANLTDAVLFGAILTGAKLDGAIWSNTDISSSVGIPQDAGLKHPEICARKSGAAWFKLWIVEAIPSTRFDSGFAFEDLSTYSISPMVPTGSTLYLDLCGPVSGSRAAAYSPPVNESNRINTENISFRLPGSLTQQGGRKRNYLQRIAAQTELLKKHVKSEEFLRPGSARIEQLVADFQQRVRELKRPMVDCLDGDSLQLILVSRKEPTLEEFHWMSDRRLDHEKDARRLLLREKNKQEQDNRQRNTVTLDDLLPWGAFFPEHFRDEDLGKPIAEAFRQWQIRRAELLGNRMTLCFGDKSTPSRLNDSRNWAGTPEEVGTPLSPEKTLVLDRGYYGGAALIALDRPLSPDLLSYSGGVNDDFAPDERKEIEIQVSYAELEKTGEDENRLMIHAELGTERFKLADGTYFRGDESQRFPLMRPKKEVLRATALPPALPLDFVVGDWLVARFAPDLLSDVQLRGMLQSRWEYEAKVENPFGGRWFAAGARKPVERRMVSDGERFREVLDAVAEVMPTRVKVATTLDHKHYRGWVLGRGGGCGELSPRPGSGSASPYQRRLRESLCRDRAAQDPAIKVEVCLAEMEKPSLRDCQKIESIQLQLAEKRCSPPSEYAEPREGRRGRRAGMTETELSLQLVLPEPAVLSPKLSATLQERDPRSPPLPVNIELEVLERLDNKQSGLGSIELKLAVRLLSITWTDPSTDRSETIPMLTAEEIAALNVDDPAIPKRRFP